MRNLACPIYTDSYFGYCLGALWWDLTWTVTGWIPLHGPTLPCMGWNNSSSRCTTTQWVTESLGSCWSIWLILRKGSFILGKFTKSFKLAIQGQNHRGIGPTCLFSELDRPKCLSLPITNTGFSCRDLVRWKKYTRTDIHLSGLFD